ncbi:internal scaffolding protein [Blackfly microvirus SF02]|uniref:Internal scaffolding protein n=1 Tax=Blackfly microvirus SF02 TaxID=2576452 RepID=A0A4P8PT75_9VIRU|nr:internal scaffolding protein [Blackfly microvirus SF02]QCQ85025.1 internal scaffolding protein [Blackfly microvirus SF02]
MSSYIIWRHQYDAERDEAEREATDIYCEDESLTVQDAPDADINKLLERFGLKDGSELPGEPLGIVDPRYYGDFSETPDLRTALDSVREQVHAAETNFQQLPARIRARFKNNAAELYQWVMDPQNIEEAVEIGLLGSKALDEKRKATASSQTVAKPIGEPDGTQKDKN